MSRFKPGVCSVCGPVPKYYAKGLCSKCYARQHRKLNPEYYSQAEKKRVAYKRQLDRKRYSKRKESGYFKLMYDKHIEQRRLDDKDRWQDPNRSQWARDWIASNLEKVRATDRAEYRRNREVHIARVMERRAHRGKATPDWLTPAQRQEMQNLYVNRPDGHHVDHIVPLRGENVCGLHVPWNLQYLPAVENLKKGNKF